MLAVLPCGDCFGLILLDELLRFTLLGCCSTGDELNFRNNCWPDGDIGELSDDLILTAISSEQNEVFSVVRLVAAMLKLTWHFLRWPHWTTLSLSFLFLFQFESTALG